jgi:hypothetical protein
MNPWKRISPILVLVIAAAGLLSWSISPAGAAAYNVTKITDQAYAPGYAFNQQGHIAWGGPQGPQKAWLYQGGVNNLIYSGSALVQNLAMNDSDQIVWDSVSSTNLGDIYLYSNGTVTQLTHHEIDNTTHAYPQINNQGDIAWVESGLPGVRVVLLKGGVIGYGSPYTGEIYFNPSLNNLGQMVWSQRQTGAGEKFQIFFYDGVTTHQLTSDTDGDNILPIINDRGDIIWAHKTAAPDWDDLRHYRDGDYQTITTELHYVNAYSYALNNLGEIAWIRSGSYIGPNLYVYYDGANHLIDNNQVLEDTLPAINNRGLVAYVVSGGKLVLTNYRTGDTWSYHGVLRPAVMQLNDRGQAAWQEALDLAFCNLWLATPTSSTPSSIINLLFGG